MKKILAGFLILIAGITFNSNQSHAEVDCFEIAIQATNDYIEYNPNATSSQLTNFMNNIYAACMSGPHKEPEILNEG